MTAGSDRPTFFRALRRERSLFALVGSVLLLFNLFQPLALAGQQHGWVICHGSTVDAGADQEPGTSRPDCPVCISGLCAPFPASQKALASPMPAFPAPVSATAAMPIAASWPAPPARAGPPPAIRAPPFTA